jgi:hypothetical protein
MGAMGAEGKGKTAGTQRSTVVTFFVTRWPIFGELWVHVGKCHKAREPFIHAGLKG